MGNYNKSLITALQARTVGMPTKVVHFGNTKETAGETGSTAGGSVSDAGGRSRLSTDATLDENAWAKISSMGLDAESGLVVYHFFCQFNQAVANLAEHITFGMLPSGSDDANDIAVFRPWNDDVRVDDGGADSDDATITYPSSGEYHYYGLAVDYAATETRFYVDQNPLGPGAADVTIEAVPSAVQNPTVQIYSAQTDATEQIDVELIGYTLSPVVA